MTHFNLLQISADNEKHPRGFAQMFHSGAASAPAIEEQNIYKEDEIVSAWVDVNDSRGLLWIPCFTVQTGWTLVVLMDSIVTEFFHYGVWGSSLISTQHVLPLACPGVSERRSEQNARCILSQGFSVTLLL